MTDDRDSVLDVEQIKKLLPHRAPLLFVERLTDIVPMESATGWKAVSFNEPLFPGPFPRLCGDARRADRGGDGPDRGRAGGAHPGLGARASASSIS